MSSHINPANVFVIIPAFNEHAVIETVISELARFKYSLIIIDDGSGQTLLPVFTANSFYLLKHRINLGQGAALQTGIDFALSQHAKYIITFDGDGQHDAGDISNLLLPLYGEKADIVFGSRFMDGGGRNIPKSRQLLLQVARIVNFIFTGLLLTDAHNGLRAMTSKAAGLIKIKQNGMAHATEILLHTRKKRLRYCEKPVTVRYTPYSIKKGQRNLGSFRILFDLLLNKFFK